MDLDLFESAGAALDDGEWRVAGVSDWAPSTLGDIRSPPDNEFLD